MMIARIAAHRCRWRFPHYAKLTGELMFGNEAYEAPSVLEGRLRERQLLSEAVIASAAKQSMPRQWAPWIASRSLSSGAHSRNPLARNDAGNAALVQALPE
jgi:hypothetical protein